MSSGESWCIGVVVGLLIGIAGGIAIGHVKTETCAPYGSDAKQCIEQIDQDPDPKVVRDEPELVVYPPETTTSIVNGR